MAKPDRETYWLVAPIFLALLPQALFLPPWVSAAAGLGLIWRISPSWSKEAPGQRILRLVLVLAATLGTFLEHHTLFGPRAGVSLLVLMGVLKLLESRGRRDHLIMTLVGYFMLMAVFIHDQRLLMAVWLAAVATLLTASLVATQSSSVLPWWPAVKLAGSLFAQALPLALLLFVLYPRLQTPIGGLVRTEQAQTGLSDRMSPGSISQLIQSDAVAFRVEFGTGTVDASKLYWRGPVLWRYYGHTWFRSTPGRAEVPVDSLSRPVNYTVTLEADDLPWLPTAGLATQLSLPDARETPDVEWLAARPIDERTRYSVRAWLGYRLEPVLSAARRAQALQLPDGFNPKAIALGRRWRSENEDPAVVVDAALAYFRQQPFYYTLNPPPLGANAVDDFLFGTRRGFCEHYAGAFTILMRAAGVPARVVTGYQGGEYNPLGNYWIVRQRDAHAWAEVWLAGRGWVRVDPTAAVAPNRIEQGIAAGLPEADRSALNLPANWLRPFSQTWDFINNGWNQWVLGYDFERQRRTLNAVSPSLANLRGMLWALLAGAGLLLGGLSLFLFRPTGQPRPDEASVLYARFLRKLARTGLVKGRAEGPSSFAARVGRQRPELARDIETVTKLYTDLRYGKAPREWLDGLRRAVRGFRPGRRPHRG
jgi:transglutaminase-like putative cysteine protease